MLGCSSGAAVSETGIVPNRLLTVQEVARVLHVNVKTIRRGISGGLLPVVRLGRVLRIHPNEVKRIIATGLSI